MEFRIADTFTDSLARLAGDEQKLVKTAAFNLQMNRAQPGMQFHKLNHLLRTAVEPASEFLADLKGNSLTSGKTLRG